MWRTSSCHVRFTCRLWRLSCFALASHLLCLSPPPLGPQCRSPCNQRMSMTMCMAGHRQGRADQTIEFVNPNSWAQTAIRRRQASYSAKLCFVCTGSPFNARGNSHNAATSAFAVPGHAQRVRVVRTRRAPCVASCPDILHRLATGTDMSVRALDGSERFGLPQQSVAGDMVARPECKPHQAATVFSDTIFCWIWGGTTSYFSSCMLNWARPAAHCRSVNK